MAKTVKEMKKVGTNPLSSGGGTSHISELERIRRNANMEAAFPDDHFDAQTYNFDTTTVVQPDMKKKKPYSKSTEGVEDNDAARHVNKNVGFPVRKKFRD